jgi:hypothetical protein
MGYLTPQHAGCQESRLHRFLVARAPAEDPGEVFPNLFFTGIIIFGQQRPDGKDHCRGAIPALDRASLNECLLDKVQPGCLFPTLLGVIPKTLYGYNRVTCSLHGEQPAGIHRFAVQQNGACSTFAMAATSKFHTEKPIPAQDFKKGFRRLAINSDVFMIDIQLDRCHSLSLLP